MDNGWIKLYRKILDNPVVMKNVEYLAMWVYLLMSATHKNRKIDFNGEFIEIVPGQLVTGRKAIERDLSLNQSKVQRILKALEIEQLIEQQTTPRGRLITIRNWEQYQDSEHQIEQQVNNKRTTSEQQVNTNKNVRIKECKNERSKEDIYSPAEQDGVLHGDDPEDKSGIPYRAVVNYLNDVCGTNYRHSSKATRDRIRARHNEGYSLDDFKHVIDVKYHDSLLKRKDGDPVFDPRYLRPETLFGKKFEGYLNQPKLKPMEKPQEEEDPYANIGITV